MRCRHGSPRTALVGLVGLALTAACGIPTGGQPETIPPHDVPYGLASTDPPGAPAPSPAPRTDEPSVYLVTTGDVLVPRGRAVGDGTVERRLAQLLADLAAGPTSAELGDQLTTALPPEVDLSLTALDGDTATIDLSTGEDASNARASRRVVGQIVLTATSVPGVRRVLLTGDGDPVEAPLPSGVLTSAPLTAEDYAALLTS